MNRRRRNTTLSLTVLVQCPNGLRCGKKSRGFVSENMIAGPQRIILYPEKGEINITAGAILYYLLIHHRSYTSAYAYGPYGICGQQRAIWGQYSKFIDT